MKRIEIRNGVITASRGANGVFRDDIGISINAKAALLAAYELTFSEIDASPEALKAAALREVAAVIEARPGSLAEIVAAVKGVAKVDVVEVEASVK